LNEIQKLPEEVRELVYSKFKGPVQFDMQVEKCFAAIRPWVEHWVNLQVASMLQREVFASNRAELEVEDEPDFFLFFSLLT
jgi:hypothetical protein